jgi:glutamate-1-semialdehyde 2,1-aminomutase
MVFSKFFKNKGSAPAEAESASEAEETPAEDEEEVAPEEWDEPTWAERAAKILPAASSTGSKRPDALYGEASIDEPHGPTHFTRANGCTVETFEGESFIDCTMALGSVAIGYGDERVTRAVLQYAGSGNAAGLAPVIEVEVAERFCELVPCAEKAQFLKTGAEAMSAAVRIARAYTGRDAVVGCGYFGWHDWCSSARGVPAAVQQNFTSVPFDDIGALESAVRACGNHLAAVVLEPVIERMPSEAWVRRARELCDEKGAVLIFDEIKTGFRLATGGYQELSGITPDLAAFGKALANGYPLSAVCGRADLMDALRTTWVSSTLASEATALAAAFAVIEVYREDNVCAQLAEIGRETQRVIGQTIQSSGMTGVSIAGLDAMWMFRFESADTEAQFVRAAVRHGALFKRGAYNFAALAHDEESILAIESAANNAFVELVRGAESD